MRITPLQNTEQGMAHVWLLHVPLPTALEREEGEGDQKKKQVGALATVEEGLDVLLRPSRLRLPFHPPASWCSPHFRYHDTTTRCVIHGVT
jgi:hypothetical protein